jgi:hypothetical protein
MQFGQLEQRLEVVDREEGPGLLEAANDSEIDTGAYS